MDDETTLSPQVEKSILQGTGVVLLFVVVVVVVVVVERKQNRSLFKKLFQVGGNGAKGNTLRR